ncbi:MAG: SGNH/GDSL hydrolase family protein [Pseudomonadota bacterium]
MVGNRNAIIVAVIVWLLPAFGLAKDRPIRIMPLGDSITQGYKGQDSYRRNLWLKLITAGIEADFVGSLKKNYRGKPLHADFDMDHEGHWGWRADHVLAKINEWSAKNTPDIVLLHLGTNDIGTGEEIEETAKEISDIIGTLRKQNSRVSVLLAQIIPVDDEAANKRIKKFNHRLELLAKRIGTTESPVISVNHFDGFDPKSDTDDGVHPNEMGMEKMAETWFQALTRLVGAR